jgi:hypothetical protein
MLSYIESLVGIGCFTRNDKLEGRNYHYMTIIRFSLLVYIYFNGCLSVHDDNYTIIIPTKCTRFLLLKSQDITICNFVLYFCPYMFQPASVIFRGPNASAWLKLLLITIY